jgi:hypothetical protein
MLFTGWEARTEKYFPEVSEATEGKAEGHFYMRSRKKY